MIKRSIKLEIVQVTLLLNCSSYSSPLALNKKDYTYQDRVFTHPSCPTSDFRYSNRPTISLQDPLKSVDFGLIAPVSRSARSRLIEVGLLWVSYIPCICLKRCFSAFHFLLIGRCLCSVTWPAMSLGSSVSQLKIQNLRLSPILIGVFRKQFFGSKG